MSLLPRPVIRSRLNTMISRPKDLDIRLPRNEGFP
jgi:hypothetical protein